MDSYIGEGAEHGLAQHLMHLQLVNARPHWSAVVKDAMFVRRCLRAVKVRAQQADNELVHEPSQQLMQQLTPLRVVTWRLVRGARSLQPRTVIQLRGSQSCVLLRVDTWWHVSLTLKPVSSSRLLRVSLRRSPTNLRTTVDTCQRLAKNSTVTYS